jgi:hypothetical protein
MQPLTVTKRSHWRDTVEETVSGDAHCPECSGGDQRLPSIGVMQRSHWRNTVEETVAGDGLCPAF